MIYHADKIISQHCVLTIYKEIRYVFFETLQYFIFFNFKLNNVGNVFPDQGATGSDYPCNVSIAPTCTPVKKQLIPGPKVINKLYLNYSEKQISCFLGVYPIKIVENLIDSNCNISDKSIKTKQKWCFFFPTKFMLL